MFDKKRKIVLKTRPCRKRTCNALRQLKRSGPYCAACDISFRNSTLFEYHLRTREHKMMDSPLELILQHLKDAESPESPREYENLRLQVARPERGHSSPDHDYTDISDMLIGADCIKAVQVFFCGVCNTFIPEDDPDALRRHSLNHETLKV